ncbi:kinase interacting (KIP1-like) family protein, partial [Trifolium pratense]
EENRKVLEEKNSLIKSVSELKDAKSAAEDENSVMFHEALNLESLSMVYESFFIEKVLEQKELSKHLSDLHSMNNNLKQELGLLR